MTVVKICGITELEQACRALQAGADLLGFVLAPSRRRLPAEVVAEILLHCRRSFPPDQRPWQAVGVFANQPLAFVQRAGLEAGLDCLQLSGEEPPDYCLQLSLPLFKALHLPAIAPAGWKAVGPNSRSRSGRRKEPAPTGPSAALSPQLSALRTEPELRPLSTAYLEEARREYGASRLLLDCGGSGRWGGTGLSFAWETVGEAARDCLVAGGLDPENVATAIATMRPWGVDVSSGVERDGKKDRELIERFIHQAKGSDHHGNLG